MRGFVLLLHGRLLSSELTLGHQCYHFTGIHLFFPFSETTVVLEQEIMLDGTMVSAAFDNTMDMGIVGTTAGTLWYISWSGKSSIRLVSGHKAKVPILDIYEKNTAGCIILT